MNSFNKKLKKVINISETLQPSESLSALEKDLLLSYLRDLYEIVQDVDTSAPTVRSSKIETPQIVQAPKAEIVVPETAPQTSSPVEVVRNEPSPAPKVVEVAPTPEVKSTPSVTVQHQSLAHLDELFTDEAITDLSDKLASTHIPDLRKAMSINERLFTQNEQFGNDGTLMSNALEKLNAMSSFDEAKHYLIDQLVVPQNWLTENKIKKAATFIKMVKRHFA
ncbi:MAG: hypothetical protein KDC04_04945 [Saprospiraceae bacterium]|nr:hypothetical protein [Saprospiraceae bacterium]